MVILCRVSGGLYLVCYARTFFVNPVWGQSFGMQQGKTNSSNRIVWRYGRQTCRQSIPSGMRDWLFDSASLTRRLQGLCPDFHVTVTALLRARPMRDEAALLGMRQGGHALVRHVYLRCAGTPVVFARTVIPLSALRGSARRLSHLGNRPLGAVLFSDRSMRRGEMQVACLDDRDALYRLAVNGIEERPGDVWGRRSVFYLAGKPLLVSEIFLPHVTRLEECAE